MANRARTGRTDGQDKRGNSKDRAARRAWLLSTKSGFGGNGEVVPCALGILPDCLILVNDSTMEVDRVIPGALGGRYTRDNIRPACGPCNLSAGHATKQELALAGRA